MKKKLGKIRAISFGSGGYQDAMIGFTFDLGGDGWGVGDFWGHWSTERSENTMWTEEERFTSLGKTVMRMNQLMSDAKVSSLTGLKGVPVEVALDGNTLSSWRILTEVR